MKLKSALCGAAALILCLAAAPGLAEIHSLDREENGKVTETVWLDENDQPTAGPDGYASVRYTYRREETTEQYYDAEGNPCLSADGAYAKKETRDGKGNLTQVEYLDTAGQRMLNRKGYCMMTIGYYGFGEVKLVTYYGLNKRPVVVPSLGYASVLTQYSNRTMSSRTYRDEKGNPIDNAEGYAEIRQKLNKRFQVLSTRYDHADGSPATGPDGWFRCVRDRDDKGRLVNVKYYGTDTQLTDRGEWYAWEGYSYEGDSIIRVTHYDLNDRVVADADGVATLVREMKDDRVVSESFLDSDGNPAVNGIGVGRVLYAYDLHGALEKVSYQDTEGNPVRCTLGYAGYRDTRDEDGATVSRTYLGTDGLAAELPAGYCEIRYFYNEYKQLTSTRYYDLNGKQIQAE